jgi:hypothetical protein
VQILATTKENLFIPVDPPDSAGDVTQYVCEAALIHDDGTEPAEEDYHPATWIGGEVALLVGPGGGIEYPAGDYMAFARITAGAERPVMRSGRVRVGGGPP